MRGAVLHKLGRKYVKERVINRHYGFQVNRPFEVGKDPQDRKYIDASGREFCSGVMQWFIRKVSLFNRCTDTDS